jgi:NAD(P)-dependent dehydrogenase (short-subunit alcohol dehydrogenase family)
MHIADGAVLITGANRGLGRALVEEALRRGEKRVYAGARKPFVHSDERVTTLSVDVTDVARIRAAADKISSLDMLINNAGLSLYEDFSDRAALDQHLAINLLGPYDGTQAVLPLLTRSQGAIVNVLSLASLAPSPFNPAYSVSKAAAFSMSQGLRALLARRGVRVHAVHPGPMDTDMTRDLDIPKTSAESAARANLRRRGARRRRNLARSDVGGLGGGLAQQRQQGARAQIGGVRGRIAR